MSSVWSRPLVGALAERRGQAASCHAGLRCHALSSDWVTVQIEKVTVSRQHGCHSHLHTHTCTPYNPWRKAGVIWNLCVLVVSFGGVLYLCQVVSHQSEIIAGRQSAIYLQSREKCVWHPTVQRIRLSSSPELHCLPGFISVTPLEVSRGHWSCGSSPYRPMRCICPFCPISSSPPSSLSRRVPQHESWFTVLPVEKGVFYATVSCQALGFCKRPGENVDSNGPYK